MKHAPMPIYRNRTPMPDNTPVWHYTSLAAAIAMLDDGQIRLTRVDRFSDPFEGSVPKSTMEEQLVLLSGAQATQMQMSQISAHYPGMDRQDRQREDGWSRLTRLRRAKTRSAHVICWAAAHESEAMWRLYCRRGDELGVGVALRTTLGKLEDSVAQHDLYVSPVRYRYYHEGNSFTDELDAFMHKRMGFEHEHEVRLLKFDEGQYAALCPLPDPTRPVTELKEHLYLDWPAANVIEEIVLSPYSDQAYENLVKTFIEPRLPGRVTLSVLSERRYAPHF
jgi:hypothetical protein